MSSVLTWMGIRPTIPGVKLLKEEETLRLSELLPYKEELKVGKPYIKVNISGEWGRGVFWGKVGNIPIDNILGQLEYSEIISETPKTYKYTFLDGKVIEYSPGVSTFGFIQAEAGSDIIILHEFWSPRAPAENLSSLSYIEYNGTLGGIVFADLPITIGNYYYLNKLRRRDVHEINDTRLNRKPIIILKDVQFDTIYQLLNVSVKHIGPRDDNLDAYVYLFKDLEGNKKTITTADFDDGGTFLDWVVKPVDERWLARRHAVIRWGAAHGEFDPEPTAAAGAATGGAATGGAGTHVGGSRRYRKRSSYRRATRRRVMNRRATRRRVMNRRATRRRNH